MERQEGYYWVKKDGNFEIGQWIPADIKRDGWWMLTGEERDYDDSQLDYINENRIKYPGELPD